MTIGKAVPAQWAVRVVLGKVGEALDRAVLGTPAAHLSGATLKARLMEEFDGKCVYCQKPIDQDYEADHIAPTNRFHGGLQSIGNLVASCRVCNLAKGGKTLDEFLKANSNLDGVAIKKRIANRKSPVPAVPDSELLLKVTQNLHAQVSSLVEETYLNLLDQLQLQADSSPKTKAAPKISEIDYSKVSIDFPLDSLVESDKQDLLGIVTTYSMQGVKGKRTAYVGVKDIETGKTIHRAPSTLRLIRKAISES